MQFIILTFFCQIFNRKSFHGSKVFSYAEILFLPFDIQAFLGARVESDILICAVFLEK